MSDLETFLGNWAVGKRVRYSDVTSVTEVPNTPRNFPVTQNTPTEKKHSDRRVGDARPAAGQDQLGYYFRKKKLENLLKYLELRTPETREIQDSQAPAENPINLFIF